MVELHVIEILHVFYIFPWDNFLQSFNIKPEIITKPITKIMYNIIYI